jgi:hypothetical protein
LNDCSELYIERHSTPYVFEQMCHTRRQYRMLPFIWGCFHTKLYLFSLLEMKVLYISSPYITGVVAMRQDSNYEKQLDTMKLGWKKWVKLNVKNLLLYIKVVNCVSIWSLQTLQISLDIDYIVAHNDWLYKRVGYICSMFWLFLIMFCLIGTEGWIIFCDLSHFYCN